MSIEIEHLKSPTDDARVLIAELDAELNAAYPPENRHGFDITRLFQPGVQFFIARVDRVPAGCGGIAFEHDLAELKRMYVRPRFRGVGVAQGILNRLAEEARKRGVDRMVLETGDAQHAAIRFYEKTGFTRRGAFGAYLSMHPNSIRHSVFFEKVIA